VCCVAFAKRTEIGGPEGNGKVARHIVKCYLEIGAANEINVSGKMRTSLLAVCCFLL